jgi:hypothetical protein
MKVLLLDTNVVSILFKTNHSLREARLPDRRMKVLKPS